MSSGRRLVERNQELLTWVRRLQDRVRELEAERDELTEEVRCLRAGGEY